MADERLDEMVRRAGTEMLACSLLANYAVQEPRRFTEIDAYTDGGIMPDDDGDDIFSLETVELIGNREVTVLIDPTAEKADVLRLLRKITEQLEADTLATETGPGLFPLAQNWGTGSLGEAARNLRILAREEKKRCDRMLEEQAADPTPF